MDPQEEALLYFRKLLFLLYREIGALQPQIHAELAAKAKRTNWFFTGGRKKVALDLYRKSEREATVQNILLPYVERTGLTLEDLRRAFAEGNWSNRYGGHWMGGPKWAHITEKTIELKELIDHQDWDRFPDLALDVRGLKDNQGYLIEKFDQTER